MFIVASDLDEAQRERLTSTLSLRNITVNACTLDAVQTVFVEWFCTPRSLMENSCLRVSGYGSSASKTFIVEDYPEDEFGLWAIDEATGEGYFLMMFLDMDGTTTSMLGSPESFRIVMLKTKR